MGVYLSEPSTDKDTHTGANELFRYTSSEMQGWRKNMEDARICELAVKANNKTYTIFGVFDGHGGNALVTQASKSPSSWRHILYQSCSRTKNSLRAMSRRL